MKKLLFLGFGLVLMVLGTHTALAKDSPRSEDARMIRTEKADLADRLETRTTQRCEVIQKKFDVQIARYENNAGKHTARYERMQARFTALVTRLKEAGKDTTALEAALVVLDEKIDKFAHDAASYIESLKLTQQFACDEAEEGFMGQVTETRSLLQILREDVLDIRNYWQDTLKPIIADLVEKSEE